MTVAIDQPAPDFTAAATDNQTLRLADFAGRFLVLYFYPRDNTPGCTREGESFRDLYPTFQAQGAEIVGVSRDSLRKHENFRAKYNFPFALISDADEILCQRYGVLKEKQLYGRSHIGIERSTFLIDDTGVVRQIWRDVKAAHHAETVIEGVRTLRVGQPQHS